MQAQGSVMGLASVLVQRYYLVTVRFVRKLFLLSFWKIIHFYV
jgi:hypothetical protein